MKATAFLNEEVTKKQLEIRNTILVSTVERVNDATLLVNSAGQITLSFQEKGLTGGSLFLLGHYQRGA